jgi:hypothetical protein
MFVGPGIMPQLQSGGAPELTCRGPQSRSPQLGCGDQNPESWNQRAHPRYCRFRSFWDYLAGVPAQVYTGTRSCSTIEMRVHRDRSIEVS